ncbi:nuclear transport factor 2 family protein [uncultured Roseobacter sp.]|uniref:nuclear transport factor 2 family protein n=1 Tax=uncultured Roseobacter sp. TaxID=114847 RepID=UPI00260DD868|nr:nuclear transport factor 2 family protein [uncultured Roseobacter sp.]
MTRSPSDTLRAYFASFRETNWREQIPSLFTEDADYLNFASETLSPETKNAIPWAGTWRGHADIIAFQTLLNDNFEVRGFDDHTYVEQRDQVAVFGVLLFTAKPTGKPADSDFAAHARVVDGRIASYHFYEDTFAIANAFRTDGHWSVENEAIDERVRQVPGEGELS